VTQLDEDGAAELLEAAAERAAEGDLGAAGGLAAEAAGLLPSGAERAEVVASAVQLLSSAGEAARTAGRWPEAASAQERALALAEASGAGEIEVAALAQNLAVTYKYTGRFGAAAQLYERALARAEDVGNDHLVATICHNLGGLAHARGAAAAGVPWARRSIEVRESLGDPLALAADRGALAGLLIEIDALDEAADHLHAARGVFAAFGDDLEVAIIDGNLATVALRRGDLAEAELRGRAALAGKERALGPTSPDLAVTLTTLGTIRRQRGAAREAAALHRRALAVLRPVVEPDHPLLRTIEENLAAAR
jgi:tetratricopeptide (TPR) repeat protein